MDQDNSWKHVKSFQPGWTGAGKQPILFITLEDDTQFNFPLGSITELQALVELLRSCRNIMYCEQTKDFRVASEELPAARPFSAGFA